MQKGRARRLRNMDTTDFLMMNDDDDVERIHFVSFFNTRERGRAFWNSFNRFNKGF